MTSNGPATTVPPSSPTRAALASTSATVTYDIQCGGIRRPRMSSESSNIPATWRTPLENIV